MHEQNNRARVNEDIDWRDPDVIATARAMRSVNGGHLKVGSHHWYVVLALLRGETIDDYRSTHAVLNDKGYRINNVRSRVADLRRDWGMPIADRFVEDRKYKEYWLDPAWTGDSGDTTRAREPEDAPPASEPDTPQTPHLPGSVLDEFDWEI